MSNAFTLMVRATPSAVNTLLKVMADERMSGQARVTAASTLIRFGYEMILVEGLSERLDTLAAKQDELQDVSAMMIADTKNLDELLKPKRKPTPEDAQAE